MWVSIYGFKVLLFDSIFRIPLISFISSYEYGGEFLLINWNIWKLYGNTLANNILLNLLSHSPNEGIKLAYKNAIHDSGSANNRKIGVKILIFNDIQLKAKSGKSITIQIKLINKTNIPPIIGIPPIIPNIKVVIGANTIPIRERIERKIRTIL